MNPQLLIFDLDGTLIDSRADLAGAVNRTRAHYGLDALPVDEVVRHVGDGVRQLVSRSLPAGFPEIDAAVEIYAACYRAHLVDHTTLYPGTDDGLRQLAAAGHRLALMTNKPGDATRAIMRHFGLDGLFCALVGGGDVERLKPAPDGIFACIAAAGLPAAAAWMVGDNHTDLAAAANAGIRSAFVDYGFGTGNGLAADAYFASFPELVGYFV